jgi:hypothetical protein
MLNSIIQKKSRNAIARGITSERLAFNRRHYLGGTSNYVLYQGGASTEFPYAYGSIPVPFDCYVTSVTMTANKYTSRGVTYGTPTGTSATIQIYKNDEVTQIGTKTLTYTPSENMRLTFDFAHDLEISRNDKIFIRWQSNGVWRYVDSTVILTER